MQYSVVNTMSNNTRSVLIFILCVVAMIIIVAVIAVLVYVRRKGRTLRVAMTVSIRIPAIRSILARLHQRVIFSVVWCVY